MPTRGQKGGGKSNQTRSQGGVQGTRGRDIGSGSSSGSPEMKAREYTDEKGQVHHHTGAYMDQHKGDGGAKNR